MSACEGPWLGRCKLTGRRALAGRTADRRHALERLAERDARFFVGPFLCPTVGVLFPVAFPRSFRFGHGCRSPVSDDRLLESIIIGFNCSTLQPNERGLIRSAWPGQGIRTFS